VRARLGTTFQSLRTRNFRLFATGQLTKLIGVWMLFVAQDWLVLELSNDSASALGLVTALQFAPVLLFTLYGGKLADRHDKRRLLIAANAIFSVMALGLGLLVVTDVVTLGWVFVSAALMGTVHAVEVPVRQSFVSELVTRELLPNALSLSAATFNSARIIGPAVAGLAIAAFGTGPVFMLTTVAATAPVIGLLRLNVAELHRVESPRTDTRIRDGFRYVWRRHDLKLPLALLFSVALTGFNFQVILAVLAKSEFKTGAEAFGLLSTSLAVGALGGALAGSGRRSRPSVYVVLGAAIGFGALEAAVGLAPTFWVAALLLVPTGFFMIYFAQATNQRIQLGTEPAFRGRVMAMFVLFFAGTMPIGAPMMGYFAEHFGPRLGISIGGTASLVAALAALALQLRRSGARIRLRLRPLPKFYVISPVESPVPSHASV